MIDISMCQNDSCPINNLCYRYMTVPGNNQSYADFKYVKGEGCGDFIRVEEEKYE